MDVKELSEQVSSKFLEQAKRVKRASRIVKSVLLIVGAALASVAQFAEFDKNGPTAWQIVGIAASVIVCIGALYSAFVDEDSAEQLALARKALEVAREQQEEYQDLDRIDAEFEKAIELYQVMMLARGVIEQGTRLPSMTELHLVRIILEACKRSLPIAMGFAQTDRWTVCVYKAQPDATGATTLECVAHKRAIECELKNARKWAAGTGIVGVSFSNESELIIDDLLVPSLQGIFGTAANVAKPDDTSLYRSMAAVPVMVAGQSQPWGVVTATNDRPGHFYVEPGTGIDAAEAVRALSGMIALAVACFNQPSRITAP